MSNFVVDRDLQHTHSSRETSTTTHNDDREHFAAEDIERKASAAHQQLSFKEYFRMRVHHFTFAWFASTMSTGGLAVAINAIPIKFGETQRILGLIVFFADLTIFVILTTLLIMRFIMFPTTIKHCFLHPNESMYIPCWFLSIASIILCINSFGVPYAGPWLPVTLRVLFWVYVSITFPASIMLYMTQFWHAKATLNSMNPTWCLGIFQIMLAGTIASQISTSQNSKNGVPIIIAGIMIQGLGFWFSLLIIGIFIQKIFCCTVFPPPSSRFGFYMLVGSPGFTTLALVGLGRAASIDGVFYMDFIIGVPGAANIARVFLDLFGTFFWGLSAWLFAFASTAVLMGVFVGGRPFNRMTFELPWFAFVFPNVGFTVGTMLLAEEFDSHALKIITAVMVGVLAVGLVLLWFGAIRALFKGQLMMPGKDQDKPVAGYEGDFEDFDQRYPLEAVYKAA